MGIYLSTPSTEVELEEGGGEKLRFVVGEMQGWRKNMEDAHIALTDMKCEGLSSAPKFSLFAVFDGHGGKEVAKFSKIHYPRMVLEQLVANEGDVAMALRESFHRIDELLEDPQYAALLRDLRMIPNPSDQSPYPRPAHAAATRGVTLEDSDSDDEMDTEEAEGDEKDAKHSNGHSHATHTAPSLFGEDLEGSEDGVADKDGEADESVSPTDAVRLIKELLRQAASRKEKAKGADKEKEKGDSAEAVAADADDSDDVMDDDDVADEIEHLLCDGLATGAGKGKAAKTVSPNAKAETSASASDKRAENEEKAQGSKSQKGGCSGLTVTMHDEADSKTEGSGNELHLNGAALMVPEDKVSEDFGTEGISPKPIHASPEEAEEVVSEGADILPAVPTIASAARKALQQLQEQDDQSPVVAARKMPDGAMTCNLRPHRIMAGCTAVVALQIDNQLFVANAGDSRGVLCRKGGRAYALSYDHKPQQERELNRITNAGGFVNAVGRINGNLNLSRSLGDLKYKQVVQCSREEQMITAEPDITVTRLQEGDRFFILACDGVWDCLTNQQACDFVTQRLDEGKDAATITKELLHHCLAPDTASAQGVGCDNMTFMLVLLNQ